MFKCLRSFLYESCLFFGRVRSLGLFVIFIYYVNYYLFTNCYSRAAFYVVSYSEYAEVHKQIQMYSVR